MTANIMTMITIQVSKPILIPSLLLLLTKYNTVPLLKSFLLFDVSSGKTRYYGTERKSYSLKQEHIAVVVLSPLFSFFLFLGLLLVLPFYGIYVEIKQ
jgi:hypothetical protein